MDVATDVAVVRIGLGVLLQCANTVRCRVDRGGKPLVTKTKENTWWMILVRTKLTHVWRAILRTMSCPEHGSCPLQPVVYLKAESVSLLKKLCYSLILYIS